MKITKKELSQLINYYLKEAYGGRIGSSKETTPIYWDKEPEYDKDGNIIPGTGKVYQNSQGDAGDRLSFSRDSSKSIEDQKDEIIQDIGGNKEVLPGLYNIISSGKEKFSDPLNVQNRTSSSTYNEKLKKAFGDKAFPHSNVFVIPIIGSTLEVGNRFSGANDPTGTGDYIAWNNTRLFRKSHQRKTEKEKKEWLAAGNILVDDDTFMKLNSRFERYYSKSNINRHVMHPLSSSESFNILSELGVSVEEMENIDLEKDIVFVPMITTANPNYMGYAHLIAHAIFDITLHPDSDIMITSSYYNSLSELKNIIKKINDLVFSNRSIFISTDRGILEPKNKSTPKPKPVSDNSSSMFENKKIYNLLYENFDETLSNEDLIKAVKEEFFNLITTAAGRNKKLDALGDVIGEFYAQEFLKETPANANASSLDRGTKVEMVFQEPGLNFPKESFEKFPVEIQDMLIKFRKNIQERCADVKKHFQGKLVVIDVS